MEALCPDGMHYDGSVCVATEYTPLKAECPAGSVMTGNICLAQESTPPVSTCPQSYSYDKSEDTCVAEIIQNPVPVCEEGTYDPVENACVVAEVLPGTMTCPHGSTAVRDGKICESIETMRAISECPAEFTFDDKGFNCRGRAQTEGHLACAAPYVDTGAQCTFTESVPKKIGCLDGSFLKGTSCVSSETQAPVILCPEGYTHVADAQVCRKLLWSRPTPVCPAGYTFDNLVHKCYTFDAITLLAPNPMPEESNLPLESSAPTSRPQVKATVQKPGTGKEQFIPIQTFTGSDAMRQATNLETIKLINSAREGTPTQPVFVPATP